MSGRLPSCTARDVEKALIKKGLVLVHQKGSHRYYADPITGRIMTTLPLHPGDLPRGLLKKIIRDIGMSEDEFRVLL